MDERGSVPPLGVCFTLFYRLPLPAPLYFSFFLFDSPFPALPRSLPVRTAPFPAAGLGPIPAPSRCFPTPPGPFPTPPGASRLLPARRQPSLRRAHRRSCNYLLTVFSHKQLGSFGCKRRHLATWREPWGGSSGLGRGEGRGRAYPRMAPRAAQRPGAALRNSEGFSALVGTDAARRPVRPWRAQGCATAGSTAASRRSLGEMSEPGGRCPISRQTFVQAAPRPRALSLREKLRERRSEPCGAEGSPKDSRIPGPGLEQRTARP